MSKPVEELKTVSCRLERNYIFEEEAARLLADGYVIYYFNIVTMPQDESPIIYAVFIKNLDYNRQPPDITELLGGSR